ncbi:MAG TPA: protein kinase [Polyangiaceae bacterium]|nr:protein kinase [Polyangiaceae bacterium]
MPRRDDDPSRVTVRLDVENAAVARRPASPDGAGEDRATGAPRADATGYPDYTVIGEEARGGLGRVLRARDRRLDRPVALKELLADGADARARFLREARLTARLQHPSIVPVYEIGLRADGAPFYAMKLIEGEPFDRVIGRTRTLDERLALLPNVIAVAEAIAYAHERRIIHRDLKPSNVVVGGFGETMVVDWGLAKDLDEADGLGTNGGSGPPPAEEAEGVAAIDALGSGLRTRAGDAMGTLAYMSPEQLRCETVDERTDVFALGAFLYHTLTGTAPYAGLSEVERHQRIRRAEPEPIASREPGVPVELAAIVRKAMAAAPDGRYASAKELAADLRRLQTGQLVSAHVYSRRVLFVRWLSRNRRRVAAGVLFLAALGAVAGVSTRRILRERDRAEQERARADTRAQQLTLVQARTSLDRDPTASLAWLKTSSLDAAYWSEIASIAADARARGVARHVVPVKPTAGIGNAFIAPDGITGVGSLDSSGVFAVDLRSGRIIGRWPTSSRVATTRASFTADGAHLVVGSEGGDVADLALGSRSMRMLEGHHGASAVAVAPLGHTAASCGEDGTVRTWNLDSGEMRLLATLDAPCEALAYGAGGSELATVGRDHRLRIWDLQAGTARVFPLAEGKEGESVTWSASGKTIVTMEASNEFRAWDAVEGRPRLLAPASARLRDGRFFGDGGRFTAWSWDGSVHLWDFNGGGERVLKGHTAPVEHVEVSKDGSLLVSCSEDATVRLWDLRTFVARVFRGHTGPVMECSISPDRRTLLTAGLDSTVRIWDIGDERFERALPEPDDDLYAVAFSPDGSRIATAGDETVVRVFLTTTGEVTLLEGHTGSTDRLAFLGDGSHLASASYDHTVRVWDLATRTSVVLPHEGRVMSIAPTRDGSSIVTGSEGGLVRVWDVARREAITMTGHTGRVDSVVLSPDEQLVASAGLDGTTRVWDRKSGAPLRVLGGDAGPVMTVTFAGDGSLVASAAADGKVRVWDGAGNLARVFEGHHARVRSIVASPDGQRLLTASDDHDVTIWSLSRGEPLVLAGHTDQVRHAVFSSDGRFVVSASYDLTTRLWDAQTGRLLDLFRAGDPVMRAAIAPDDGRVAFVGWDRLLHLPSVDPARFLPGEAGGMRAWLETATSAEVVEGTTIASLAGEVTR